MANLRKIDCEHYSACLDRAAKNRGKFNCTGCERFSRPEAVEEGFEHELNGKGDLTSVSVGAGSGSRTGDMTQRSLSTSGIFDQEVRMETQADYKPMSKKCTKCGEEKSLNDFAKSAMGKYGRRSICKVCDSAYSKKRNLKKRILKNAKAAGKADQTIAPGSTVLKKVMDKAKAAKGGTDKPSLSVERSADGKGGTDKLGLSVEPASAPNGRAKLLAEEHWEYVRGLLETHWLWNLIF
jgi:hypothetical protein